MKFLNGIDAQIDDALALSGHTIDDFMPELGKIRKNLGYPSILEIGAVESQFTDKLWFFNPDNVTYEKSANGTDWVNTTEWDYTTKHLFSQSQYSEITIPKGNYLRITLVPDEYVYLNMLYLYLSTNGCQVNLKIEGEKGSITPAWQIIEDYSESFSGWPCHATLRHDTIPFRNGLSDYRFKQIRLTIKTNLSGNSDDTDYPEVNLMLMGWYGGYPSGKRTIYDWDADKNVNFPAIVEGYILASNAEIGVAPLYLNSTTKVDNLNVDMVDGLHASDFALSLNPLQVPQYGVATIDGMGFHVTIPGVTSYVTGMMFNIKFNNTGIGSDYIDINVLGRVSLRDSRNQATQVGQIYTGSVHTIIYNGTYFQLIGDSRGVVTNVQDGYMATADKVSFDSMKNTVNNTTPNKILNNTRVLSMGGMI